MPANSCSTVPCVLVLFLAVTAVGQAPTSAPATRPAQDPPSPDLRDYIGEREPLARYVPIEASIYFRMSSLESWQSLLNRPAADPESGAARLRQLLVGRPRVIALPTWHERREMITLCEPKDPATFAEILSTASAQLVREDGGVRIYHFPDNLTLASNGRVFLFSDIGVGSAMFVQATRLLAGEKRDSLLEEPRFQKYVQQVDPSAAGLIFINQSQDRRDMEDELPPGSRGVAGGLAATAERRWLPDLESACVSIHPDGRALRCRIAADRREQVPPVGQAIDLRQLKLLPDTTAAAWMTPVKLADLLDLVGRRLPRGRPAFYHQLAEALTSSGLEGLSPLAELGPRSTLCLLGGDSRDGLLRAAYIIEAREASAAATALAEICRVATRILSAPQADASYELSFNSFEYEGHVVQELSSVRLKDVPDARLPRELHPAFCAIGDQLVIATDAGVIRDIINQSRRDKLSLPVFETWAAPAGRSADDTQIRAMINPALLASQLGPFRDMLKAEDSMLVQSEWFQNLRDYFNDTPVQLGARLRRDNSPTPGKVYVMHVLEGLPADGKLRTGDYITGIDGEVLALADPAGDLRKKLQSRPGGGIRLLRIERNNRIIDVEVLLPRLSDKSFRGVLDDTSNAISYLADLGRAVDLITYRQFGLDPARLEAELVFDLRPSTH